MWREPWALSPALSPGRCRCRCTLSSKSGPTPPCPYASTPRPPLPACLQDKAGHSPLLAACLRGHFEVAYALLSDGADVDLQDKESASPLLAACTQGHLDLPPVPGVTWTCLALLSAGAVVEHVDKYGQSPLKMARKRCHVEVVRVLQATGAAHAGDLPAWGGGEGRLHRGGGACWVWRVRDEAMVCGEALLGRGERGEVTRLGGRVWCVGGALP